MSHTIEYEGNEGPYYEIGIVYSAQVGHQNWGLWNSHEEAEKHIKKNNPNATPFSGIPPRDSFMPDNQYYIRRTVVFSHKKPGLIARLFRHLRVIK